jgi:hypothetical protein
MSKSARAKPVTEGLRSEWVGGTIALPAYVRGEGGTPYRPETLLWMGVPDGAVLGMTVLTPRSPAVEVVDHFRATTKKPLVGSPHVPARVRVASATLAATLREHIGEATEVVCAPTPELDAVAHALLAHMSDGPPSQAPSYLTPGVSPAAIESLFWSTARLFRAAPWKVIPDDSSVMSVTIDALGVRGGALSIIGKLGESLGWILFPTHEAFEMFLSGAVEVQAGVTELRMPSHFALNFEHRDDISPEQRKEIASHGWEVAGPTAYPWLVAIDEDLVGRPATPGEVTMTDVISAALAEMVETEPNLRKAWSGDHAVVRTTSVPTPAGPIEITLGAPFEVDSERARRTNR